MDRRLAKMRSEASYARRERSYLLNPGKHARDASRALNRASRKAAREFCADPHAWWGVLDS